MRTQGVTKDPPITTSTWLGWWFLTEGGGKVLAGEENNSVQGTPESADQTRRIKTFSCLESGVDLEQVLRGNWTLNSDSSDRG